MMEKLTQDMADAAWAIIEEVEAMGGMTKAVERGWAKLKIEASAAEKQARIDSGEDVIVGVNKYRLDDGRRDRHPRDRQRHAVRDSQIARLQGDRARRATRAAVQAALAALTAAARERRGQPARPVRSRRCALRATVGEVSDALEKVWGRHRADTQKVTGVYAAAYDSGRGLGEAQARDRRLRRGRRAAGRA